MTGGRWWLTGAIVAGWVSVAAAAPRVAVIGEAGPGLTAVRAALASHVELVVVELAAPSGGDGAVAAVLAGDHQLAAVVVVTTTGRASRPTVTITAYQGVDGAALGTVVVRERGRRLGPAIERVTWAKLGTAITGATPQPAPAPAPPPVEVAPSPPPPTTATPTADGVTTTASPAPRATRPRRARLRVALEQRPFMRRLRYNDDLRGATRRYDLVAHAVGLSVVVRPLGGVPRLELTAAGQLAVGVKGSRTTDGTSLPTRAWEWSAAAGYAVATGRLGVTLHAGFGEQRFAIDDEMVMGGELVPDVRYRWARLGAEVNWALDRRWHLQGVVGGRYLVSEGDLTAAEWFPRATGNGVDGSLALGYRLGTITLFAQTDLRRYFFAMNPEVGDPLIVGGASDNYLSAGVGVAVEL